MPSGPSPSCIGTTTALVSDSYTAGIRRIGLGDVFRPGRVQRALYYNLWFKGHTNRRMAALLPRLPFVDAFLVPVPSSVPWRSIVYRGFRSIRIPLHRVLLKAAARRYPALFTNDPEQVRWFPGPAVVDLDDPKFTDDEVRHLSRPNLVRFVVTVEEAGRWYEERGVNAPYVVIPQGVDSTDWSEQRSLQIRARFRRPEDLVVGFHAAWLLTEGDRGGMDPLYNVDHLLELWDGISSRLSNARLWLLGRPGAHLTHRLAGRSDVLVLGYVPPAELPNYLVNFDVAVYPRRLDHWARAVKVAEWLAHGIPVVAYDFPVVDDVRDSGGGVLVQSPQEFVDAVAHLLEEPTERRAVAQRAKTYGAALHWDILARRYEDQVFHGVI